MFIRIFFFIASTGCLTIACSNKTKADSSTITVKEVILVDVIDEVSPPTQDEISIHKTLQDWLYSIVENAGPGKAITAYNFGIFESSEGNIIFLTGSSKHIKGDTVFTRTELRPVYFKLPEEEYKNLGRKQLLDTLTLQLKSFTGTAQFKTSFLARAAYITTDFSGKIWPR